MENYNPKNDVIIGINASHDASVCVVHKGNIVYYDQDERILNEKNTFSLAFSLAKAFRCAREIKTLYNSMGKLCKIRSCATSIYSSKKVTDDLYLINNVKDTKLFLESFFEQACLDSVVISSSLEFSYINHHEAHAKCSFYNSGFDEAICLVIDGGGSGFVNGNTDAQECESIFYMDYDHIESLYVRGKEEVSFSSEDERNLFLERVVSERSETKEVFTDDCESIGRIFSGTSEETCGDERGAGKLMGLSAYGRENNKIKMSPFIDMRGNPLWRHYVSELIGRIDYDNKNQLSADIAYKVQNESTKLAIEYVRFALSKKKECKNVCLSGGFFYNIINNYAIVKEFPDINFYFEPIAGDEGTCLGAAYHEYRKVSGDKTKRPLKTLYLGADPDYNRDLKHNEVEIYDVTPEQVASLIDKGNVVAIYQGKAEAGPRALGNRSILYDPRDPNGRDVVNTIKKREWYRPFAGSVLEEHASEWFDMKGLKSSPFMMMAIECHQEKRELVPALQHNDGTSRIQTVSAEQNLNYYNLIKAFNELTGIPMVLNTSFNLAGDAVVSTLERAVHTCRRGKIPYLYCPERKMLIEFGDNL
jgi:carbamoyltransferase